MHNTVAQILSLARLYASATSRSLSTVSRLASGSGATLNRLEDGAAITNHRVASILQWFSDNWPAGLPWPAEIDRPAPASTSTLTNPSEGQAPGDPLEAVRTLKAERLEAMGGDDPDWQRVGALGERMHAAAMTLRADGRVASAEAVCEALGSARHVYDDVVRRYADGRGAGAPRDPDSETGRMLALLVESGDVRFASRRAA